MRRLRAEPRAVGPLWNAAAILIACGVAAPVLTLAWFALGADLGQWAHLAEHVLPTAALNTAILLVGVGVVVLVIGTGLLTGAFWFWMAPSLGIL